MASIGRSSWIDEGFRISADVVIGEGCVLRGSGTIGPGVWIGSNVVMDGDIHLGAGTRVGHGCVVTGRVVAGARNAFGALCCIGGEPEHPGMRESSGGVLIGDDNVFHEYVSVHAPTVSENTVVGNRCYLMTRVHLSHDCRLSDGVKMANSATLAGYCSVGENAYLGMHCAVHQRVDIGAYCMIGMNAVVRRHVPPFSVFYEHGVRKINQIAIERAGFDPQDLEDLREFYRTGRRPGHMSRLVSLAVEFMTAYDNHNVYIPWLSANPV